MSEAISNAKEIKKPWSIDRIGRKIVLTFTQGSEYEAVVMCDHIQDELKDKRQVTITVILEKPNISPS
jgi:hypothetical protein